MKKIYLDAGHGGKDSGAIGFGLKEKDVVLKIARYVRDYLNSNYSGHTVKMSRNSDVFLSLKQRTDEANKWGADVFISIHCNASNGKARGYEDYVYNRLKSGSKSYDLQNYIHDEVSKLFSVNRGKKQANFHVLRESRANAILTENGFIDNKHDNQFLKSDDNLRKLGEAHAKGIARFLQLNPSTESGVMYRVIAGSFQNRDNAERRKEELEKKGFDCFIDKMNQI